MELKEAIEDVFMWLEEIEKEAKMIIDANTRFQGSVVQDDNSE